MAVLNFLRYSLLSVYVVVILERKYVEALREFAKRQYLYKELANSSSSEQERCEGFAEYARIRLNTGFDKKL